MTTFDFSPLWRSTVGFDRVFDLLEDSAQWTGDNYPPYNIERIARGGNRPEHLRITLAVAGFSAGDLDISVAENELVIRGHQEDDEKSRVFLHRGIAARQFQRNFVLADGMEVVAAELKDGLLSIELERPETARVARRIQIATEGSK